MTRRGGGGGGRGGEQAATDEAMSYPEAVATSPSGHIVKERSSGESEGSRRAATAPGSWRPPPAPRPRLRFRGPRCRLHSSRSISAGACSSAGSASGSSAAVARSRRRGRPDRQTLCGQRLEELRIGDSPPAGLDRRRLIRFEDVLCVEAVERHDGGGALVTSDEMAESGMRVLLQIRARSNREPSMSRTISDVEALLERSSTH